MSRLEQQFIQRCKNQIEKKFSFGNGHGYTQRDLELLCNHIEEKTGVVISLSTIKRLWKGDYKQSPQLATLNAMAVVLDHKDWKDFKLANQDKSDPVKLIPNWLMVVVISLGIGLAVAFGLYIRTRNTERVGDTTPPTIKGPIYFDAIKTKTSGVPNTVIFKYDVSNIVADTFYIQQSWNSDHKVRINPSDNVLSSIYYESGFHRAKLIANDSVVALQPVHILSNGWEPHIYRHDSDPEIVDLTNESFIRNGELHLDSILLLKRNIDFSDRFHMRVTNSKEFNIHSDNFTFSTRIKADHVFHQVCPWMDVVIVTEVNTFTVSWTGKGCEKYAAYKLGEISRSGANNDLSALGRNVYQWQELELRVQDRHASIYLNDELSYKETYKQDFGKIVALIYIFDGTGSIDYSRLRNGNDQIVFEDNFKR